jgi:hypothetical protein
MKWSLIVLALAAAGQPASAQDSRGSGGYTHQQLLPPPKPTLDAEEAFRAGDRRRARRPDCSKPGVPRECPALQKYAEEYNRTLDALEAKLPAPR